MIEFASFSANSFVSPFCERHFLEKRAH